jgi:MSHA pilin protein MshC
VEDNLKMIPDLSRRKSDSFTAGFTIVELIAVIVIVALIAAVSGPRFFDINVFQQRGFFDETLSSIRYAQKYAVATGCAVQVAVAGNSYTLTQVPTAAFNPNDPAPCNTPPYTGGVSDPTNAGNNFTRTAPTNMTLTSIPATFVFCPRGDTSTGACTGNYANVIPDPAIDVNGQIINVRGATGFVE